MARRKNNRREQAYRTLCDHLENLGLKSVGDYQRWCAENGFSRRTQKNARERRDELACKKRAHQANFATVDDPLIGKSRRMVDELILLGEWTNRPCHDEKQRCLADAVNMIRQRSTDELFPVRLSNFRELYDVCKAKRARILDDYRRIQVDDLQMGSTYMDAIALMACYHECWIREPRKWKVGSKSPNRVLNSLINHLFVRHRIPAFLYKVWLQRGAEHADDNLRIFVHIADGHSVRTAGVGMPYSKRMSHFFMQAPSELSVRQAIRWGQIQAMDLSEAVANAIVATQLGTDFSNLEFWNTFFQWLVKHPMLSAYEVGPIVDFIRYQKFGNHANAPYPTAVPPHPNFSMKGRTPQSMLRAVERWHGRLASYRLRVPPVRWARSTISEFELEEGVSRKRIWTIHELNTSQALHNEGQLLNHCVATYGRSCSLGHTSIWSLQLHTDEMSERLLTVEVRPGSKTICQARGKCNRMPRANELRILRRWAEQAGLRLLKNLA